MLEQFIHHFSYLAIMLLLVGGGFGLPLPEDVPLLLGGYLCSQQAAEALGHRAHLWIMIPVTFFSVLGTDLAVFYLGSRLGPSVSSLPIIGRHLKPHRLAKARLFLADHGGKSLFIARFLPGLRAVAYASAGALHVPFWKMVVFDGSAALISVPTLVLLGWHFSDWIDGIRQLVHRVQFVLLGVIAVAVVVFIITHRLRRKKEKAAAMTSLIAGAPPPSTRL
jgi:membrane protein DedA with SNARE-associated domain